MQEVIFNKKQTVRYLIWTFGIAYQIQAAVALMYANGLTIAYQIVMMAMMFVPLLGTLLSGYKLRNIGWKPPFRGNLKPILIAWLSPVVLTAIGAAVYFLLFPSHLDLSGNSLSSIAGVDAVAQLEAQGISYPIYILITVASSVTYAPAINIFLAVGEEAGWRGFLYPQLKAKFSKGTAWIIGGVIWGMWHWPLIGLIGYEYGSDYFGFPALGMLAFCVITVALGIISDWLYEKSGCIWIPALFHGAFNAVGTLPLMITVPDTGTARLLGSAPVGLLAGLPIIIFAVVLLLNCKKNAEKI